MVSPINSQSIQSMLQTLRSHQTQAGGGLGGASAAGSSPAGKVDFAQSIQQAIGKVNDLQLQSDKTTEAYQRGENVPLTDVVLNMQKASLSFEATLQVRNKVLKAYEDILNMPV